MNDIILKFKNKMSPFDFNENYTMWNIYNRITSCLNLVNIIPFMSKSTNND